MELTVIITVAIAAVFIAVIVNEIRKKKQGKGTCSCGGSCGACGMNCSCDQTKK